MVSYTFPHLKCRVSNGVRKPNVPMEKHITGGSGVSSANSDAKCLHSAHMHKEKGVARQVRTAASAGHSLC
jgi:hypothetical protein